MDPTLQHWKSHGQSFLSRVQIWVEVLDPSLLLASEAEIKKAHSAVARGQTSEKDAAALPLALSSVHADSGAVLPFVFRPPALLPIAAPLAVASCLPHSTVAPALFWQFLLQSYSAGFNYANRSSSKKGKKMSVQQLLLMAGTVSYTAFSGALPQIIIKQLRVKAAPAQVFLRSVLPMPLSAALAYFNVSTVRSGEPDSGIQVFDSSGNPVGLSRAAGEKAVSETAWSRAALIGTTATLPNLLILLLQRTRLFQRNPMLVTPVRHISIGLVFGLMIPVSLSLYPQLGTIEKERLERGLQAAAVDGHLFYHRGL